MDLQDLSQNWDALGDDDPMWAILSDPSRRGNRWDESEFFATGERQVNDCLRELGGLHLAPPRQRALDFGCGAGRLAQALAGHFDKVDGVDIAPSMIRLADKLNAHVDKVNYHLNQSDDLALFENDSFDFVLSLIVFQHMENRYKERYLAEFVRILRPQGLAMVTIPSHPRTTLSGIVYRLPNPLLNFYRRRRYGNRGVMELHGMRREDVLTAITNAGGKPLDITTDDLAGGPWHSYRYLITPNA